MADTGNWTMVEALGSGVGGGVLLLGAFVAQRYGHRVNARLQARTFARIQGGTGLEVEVEVRYVGITKFKFMEGAGADHLPTLTVYDVVDDGLRYDYREQESRIVKPFLGQTAGPGEVMRCHELFHLRSSRADVVGWQVELVFDMRRRIRKWDWFTYEETTFVPLVGPDAPIVGYNGGQDGEDEATG